MSERSGRSAVVYDSRPLWVNAVGQVLAAAGVRVAGRTTSVSHARTLVQEHAPDLLIMEIDESESEALGLLRELHRTRPDLKALVLSDRSDVALVSATLVAGAFAFIVKTADPEDLAFAVRQAFGVSTYLAQPTSARDGAGGEETDGAANVSLTRREVEILRLLSEGRANADMARELWVTEQTVKFHLSNIYRKLGLANRTQAARWAQTHGLL